MHLIKGVEKNRAGLNGESWKGAVCKLDWDVLFLQTLRCFWSLNSIETFWWFNASWLPMTQMFTLFTFLQKNSGHDLDLFPQARRSLRQRERLVSRRFCWIFRGKKQRTCLSRWKQGEMDWFQQVLRKCSQIVPQKIELSGTGQGMATLAAWPASTPWALGHDSAKVAFSVAFSSVWMFSVGSCGLKWEKKLCSSVEKSVETSTQWGVTLETLIWQLFCNCWAAVQIQCCVPIYLLKFLNTRRKIINPRADEMWTRWNIDLADWNLESKRNNTMQQKRGKAMISIKIKITCSFISYI